MNNASGVVVYKGYKDFAGNKRLWTIKLDGDDNWYRCGTKEPDVQKGFHVTFEWSERKGQCVVEGNVSVSVAPQSNKKTSGSVGAREDYWQNKAEEDVLRDKRIRYQSAHNTAVAMLAAAAAGGQFPVVVKDTKKGFEAVKAYVFELADELYSRYDALTNEDGPQSEEVEVVEAEDEKLPWE